MFLTKWEVLFEWLADFPSRNDFQLSSFFGALPIHLRLLCYMYAMQCNAMYNKQTACLILVRPRLDGRTDGCVCLEKQVLVDCQPTFLTVGNRLNGGSRKQGDTNLRHRDLFYMELDYFYYWKVFRSGNEPQNETKKFQTDFLTEFLKWRLSGSFLWVLLSNYNAYNVANVGAEATKFWRISFKVFK